LFLPLGIRREHNPIPCLRVYASSRKWLPAVAQTLPTSERRPCWHDFSSWHPGLNMGLNLR